MKIRNQLALAFTLVLLVPLISFTPLWIHQLEVTLVQQARYSFENSFSQTSDLVELLLRRQVNISKSILQNEHIGALLNSSWTEGDVYRQRGEELGLNQELAGLSFDDQDYKSRIYVPDDRLYSSLLGNYPPLASAIVSAWYPKLTESQNNLVWQRLGTDVACFQRIFDPEDYSKMRSIVAISVPSSTLETVLGQALPNRRSVAYLVDESDQLVASSRISDSGEPALPLVRQVLPKLTGSLITEAPFSGTQVILGAKSLASSGLFVVVMVPLESLLETSNRLKAQFYLLVLAISALGYLILVLLTSSVSRRARSLSQVMHRVYEGDFAPLPEVKGRDEITDLQNSFNFMARKLAEADKTKELLSAKAREYELMALQAQINPHFLYNTLDLIQWAGKSNDIRGVSTLVRALAGYYKISLSAGAELIPIAREVAHVGHYVEIQRLRYPEVVSVTVEVAPEVTQALTLKIILQPLVENAIVHGILAKPSKQGRIHLEVMRRDTMVVFTVTDDGVGFMPPEGVPTESVSNTKELHGYGVRNINARIQLAFGSGYGVFFLRSETPGTRVEVRLPWLAPKEDNE